MLSPENLKILNSAGKQLAAAAPSGAEAVWKTLMEAASSAYGCEAASFFEVDEAQRLLTLKFVLGSCSEDISNLGFGYQGIVGWCADNKESAVINDTASDFRFCSKVDKATGFSTKVVLCAPAILNGALLGIIELINPKKGSFDENDRELMDFLCVAAAKTAGNKRT